MLKIISKVCSVALLILIGMILLDPSGVSAAETGNSQHITITPVSNDIKARPGGTSGGSLTVLNQGSDSFNATVTASPYRVEGDQYDPKYTRLDGTTDASEWVDFTSDTKALLSPNGVLYIKYNVSVPATTQPGGYYAVIFAETNPVKKPDQGVIAHNRVGHILYITVEGDVKNEGSVVRSSLPFIVTGDKLEVPIKVKNSGGVHFKSSTRVVIKDILGNTVLDESQERYVLPQTQREFTFDWKIGLPIGIYKVERTAGVLGSQQSLEVATVVVAHPLTIIGGLILITGFIYLIFHRKKSRGK